MADRFSCCALGLALGLLSAPMAGAEEPTVPLASMPGWAEDAPSKMVDALLASCLAWAVWPAERPLLPDPTMRGGSPEQWRPFCEAVSALDREHPRPRVSRRGVSDIEAVRARDAAFREMFEARLVAVPLGPGLLTGYYEPVLRGSRTPDDQHRTPLLARPLPGAAVASTSAPPASSSWAGRRVSTSGQPLPGATARHEEGAEPWPQPEPTIATAGHGLPPVLPLIGSLLPTRGEIAAGALAGRGLELAYLANPADAFFLHIQGSGRVELPDGKVLRLGYAAQNGHRYISIGRVMINRGLIAREAMSMQAIRDWLSTAPEAEAEAMMAENPSYIFFRELEGLRPDQGPRGSLGVPLTPGRSLAVDRSQIPLGAPVFIAGRDPVSGAALNRLTLAQDTGGAIRGRARGDLFWGWGEAAGAAAGRARDEARFWLLLPNEVAAAP